MMLCEKATYFAKEIYHSNKNKIRTQGKSLTIW